MDFPVEAINGGFYRGIANVHRRDSGSAAWGQRSADIYQTGTTFSSDFCRRAAFGWTKDAFILGACSWLAPYE